MSRSQSSCPGCIGPAADWLCGRRRGEPAKKPVRTPLDLQRAQSKNRYKSVITLDDRHSTTSTTSSAGKHSEGRLRNAVRQLVQTNALRSTASVLQAMTARHGDPKAVAREAVVLVMVGLPARGKSYLSGAVLRHLRLLGVRVRNFNAGELRRETGAAGGAGAQADFFDSKNQEAKSQREALAMECCNALLKWIAAAPPSTSSVGILDATNTTQARRRNVMKCCRDAAREGSMGDSQAPMRLIFLESICDDPVLLEDNYGMKLKNDDYKNSADAEAALDDFRKRVAAYEQQYEPLDESELDPPEEDADVPMPTSCVRIFNGGQKIICCRTGASLVAAPFISLLHAMHLTPRRVLLAPECREDGEEIEAGVFAALLSKAEREEGKPIDVLVGASRRGALLAQKLELMVPAHHKVTDGSTNGETKRPSSLGRPGQPRHQPRAILTLRALQTRHTGTFVVGGEESYADLVRRMRSEVILLLERLPRSVLVVCPGEDVRRVLLAHFLGCNVDSIAEMEVPPSHVIQLVRDHKGFHASQIELPSVTPLAPSQTAK